MVIVIFFISAYSAYAVDYLPIVPCGRAGTPECNTCHFFQLGQNVLNFVLEGLLPALSFLFFIIAGALILLGGANQSLVSRGRQMFRYTVIGILIILASYMIVTTILKSIVPDDISTDWNKITCTVTVGEVPALPVFKPGPILPPTIEIKGTDIEKNSKLSSQILGNKIIGLSTNADCGSNHARKTVEDMAKGQLPPVCSAVCTKDGSGCTPGGPSGNITVNPKILEGVLRLAERYQFTIISLTTGHHSSGSTHYSGEAVDIKPASKDSKVWIEVRALLKTFGGTPICEQIVNGKAVDNPSCDLKVVNHIHWTLRRSDKTSVVPPPDLKACPISIKPWNGADPYIESFSGPSDPAAWQNTKPELKQAFEALQKKYPNIKLISTWRPQEYQDHIRSVWDAVRFVKGESVVVPTSYGECSDAGKTLSPPSNWQACDADFKKNIDTEAKRHDSYGPTRPSCTSDHIRGIALDVTVSGVSLREFVQYAESLSGDIKLCHYIASDAPHFGIEKYLPANTVCGQGI